MRNIQDPDCTLPVSIDEGIWWVGFNDPSRNLHCNPYLIVEKNEAVLIDSGSRTEFPSMMSKVLQTGVDPASISALIYHHYDPDLCSNLPHVEELVGKEDLRIISHRENNVFIRYYQVASPLVCIEDLDRRFRFASGRTLRFVQTPYAHTPGSFVTFDERTGTVFSSDLFGSFDTSWRLFLDLEPACREADEDRPCAAHGADCPVERMLAFHRVIMPCGDAVLLAVDRIAELEPRRICPQHGRIVENPEDIACLLRRLRSCRDIGIDAIVSRDRSGLIPETDPS